MRILFSTMLAEHEHLRDVLRGLLLLAARAEEGDVEAWHALTQRDLVSDLDRHAQHERVEQRRVFPGDDPFQVAQRQKLDALHQTERRAAMLVRVAPDLADVMIHVGEIIEALAEEEKDLMAAGALLEGPVARHVPFPQA